MAKRRQPTFLGLQKYSHKQRHALIQRLIPYLKKELGGNLIAIAADASYARFEDTDFSDIELVIFVHSTKTLPRGFSKIIRGVLVEGVYVTEPEYYRDVLEPNPDWYISGSDVLMPITNARFIRNVQRYRVHDVSKKCLVYARESLMQTQEAFGKLFTALRTKNQENLFLIISDATLQVLKLMSFMNATPYKTLGSFITQAKGFKIKPKGFDEFIEVITAGTYTDMKLLEERATVLFKGIEDYFRSTLRGHIYDDDLSTIATKRM